MLAGGAARRPGPAAPKRPARAAAARPSVRSASVRPRRLPSDNGGHRAHQERSTVQMRARSATVQAESPCTQTAHRPPLAGLGGLARLLERLCGQARALAARTSSENRRGVQREGRRSVSSAKGFYVCRLGCASASLSCSDRISKGNRLMNMLRRKRMSRRTSFRCITEKALAKAYAAAPLFCATIIGDRNIRTTKASLFTH